MIRPFKGNYFISQKFGKNPQLYARFGLKGHNGIDWAIPRGIEILAPINGKIVESAFDSDGYGHYVKIENDKWGVVLAHFMKRLVKVGAAVNKGDPVGLCDSSGYSTGDHLHMGVHPKPRDRNNGFNGYIDFLNLLDAEEDDITPEEFTKIIHQEIDARLDRSDEKFANGLEKTLEEMREEQRTTQKIMRNMNLTLTSLNDVLSASQETLTKINSNQVEFNQKVDALTKEVNNLGSTGHNESDSDSVWVPPTDSDSSDNWFNKICDRFRRGTG